MLDALEIADEDWPVPDLSEEHMSKQVKAAYCPICKGWTMVGAFPRCETDAGAKRRFTAELKRGCTIKVISMRENCAAGHVMCTGHSKPKAKKP